jgi:hypothetical protein
MENTRPREIGQAKSGASREARCFLFVDSTPVVLECPV